MTSQQLIKHLRERFPGKILEAWEPVPNQVFITVEPQDMPEVCGYVFNDMKARFGVGVGTDYRPQNGKFRLSYDFSFAADHIFLVVETYVSGEEPKAYSITPQVPAASWAEREIQDLLGVKLVGHPDPRRLVLPDDWPEGIHPLRKDVPFNVWPPSMPEYQMPRHGPPEGATVVPIGPFYPVLEEPAYFRLFVEGERIVGCDYRGFYNHRGIEKIGESDMNYNQIPFLAERICGI